MGFCLLNHVLTVSAASAQTYRIVTWHDTYGQTSALILFSLIIPGFNKLVKLINLILICSGFAMDVIACCGYGIELDSINTPNHPVVVNAKQILNVDASFSMIVSSMFPAVGRLLGLEPFNQKAVQFFDDLTFQIVQQRMANGCAKRTFTRMVGSQLQTEYYQY